MFQSLPLAPREIHATEAVLDRVYNSARLGLRGEALALRAGLLPVELTRLRQFDEVVEMAVLKGYADAEVELTQTLYAAARAGDAKIALEILKHRHDWVAKQHVKVDDTRGPVPIVINIGQVTSPYTIDV